jgi:TolA-binding protein
MNRKGSVLIFYFFVIILSQTLSQVPFTGDKLASDYTIGMELFGKEKYPAAIKHLDSFIEKNDPADYLTVAEASYFRALSSLYLFNPDAEYRMISYIRTYPESPRINEGLLALGNYFFQNKNYRKAVSYFEQVNRQELSSTELPQYFFRLGYSLYLTGDKSRALLMFSEIKDIDTEYTPPAVYYFSQIAYEQKMYQTAMDGFTRLKKDESFGAVVPFYIVQILYLQKDYDGILEIAPDLLASAPKERAVELYRFIGDAYYNKGNYSEALPYLEKFSTGTKISAREDKYQLGYCYYKTGDLNKAIKIFLEIGNKTDLLSQNIWFLLGDSYLQTGNKQRAQFGFAQASKMDFDKKIKEDALFNYAKLMYETSYSPFGEVIAAFREYIDNYPGSERIQEAYNYLIAAYMQSKNYKAAVTSLDKVSTKDSRLEEAYQRVAFYRGLELFKNLEMDAAIDMFDRSLKYGKYNRTLRARAIYWRGEAWYRLGNYENAKTDYTEFMGIPGSMLLAEYNMVRYNLGYTFYNLKDYSSAMTHFKNFESGVTNVRPEILADAKNRIADCYYITTNYPQAISYYDKVIEYGKVDADYAMFQKGFSLGFMNDERGKADVLSALTLKFPASSYVPNAIYERGRAYVVLEDFRKGEVDFNTVVTSFQSSPFVPRSMVQLGLLYYNTGENEKAISQYKQVIEKFKSTPEARDALTGLKNVYVEMNDVEAYFSYVRSLEGYGDVNLAEKDSMLYTSGENLYITGKYDRACEVFRSYLKEFPNGSFRQNAQFYLAESLRTSGNADEALGLYAAVAAEPNNQFTEQSLVAAASISYDKEDYKTSLQYYEMLEKAAVNQENKIIALHGQLRSAYQQGDPQKTISAAEKINISGNISEELSREATFMKAKANYSLNNFDEALGDFRKVAVEVVSAEGAESKYRVAELLFKKEQVAESEKTITEFINQNTPHQYWMARMFLLLADISIKKGDMLQARATLQSLKDYYSVDNDGIMDEVKAKLDTLNQNN